MIYKQINYLSTVCSSFFYNHKRISLVFIFATISLLIYGHFVFMNKFTASGDFGPAVSYALNFKEAINNGQWIPRWIVNTRELTLGAGSIDGTPLLTDSPVFQYYAFLQSALAYPFLLIGISAITSIQLAIILAFTCSGIILYKAGRVLGANQVTSFLSGYSYIISPWLISNFYGRGGISESLGQSLLPLILLGYSYAIKSIYDKAFISISLAIMALALSHNIFMLYGIVMCCILLFTHFILPYLNVSYAQLTNFFKHRSKQFSGRFETDMISNNIQIQLILGMGLLIGLALSSWQWIPALMTLKELSFNYIGNFDTQFVTPQPLADLTGTWGFPKQFVEPWAGGIKREYFFTIGWWTIPGIMSLIFAKKNLKMAAWGIFFSFSVFFILTYWPRFIFPYLPSFFGATQFTFRYLAFLSVLGSFALSIGLPNISKSIGAVFILLITISQLPVILFHMPDQKFPDTQYLRGYEYNAFYANSIHEEHLRFWYNGWLEKNNILNLENSNNMPAYLKITGKTANTIKNVELFIAKSEDIKHPVSNIIKIQEGNFQAVFKINKPENSLRLYAISDDPHSKTTTYLIRPENVLYYLDPSNSYIPSSVFQITKSYGYKRIFSLPPEKLSLYHPNKNGMFTVQLPVVYNKFSIPFQNGIPLNHEIGFNHELIVTTNNVSSPIIVQYILPIYIWAMTILGIIVMSWAIHGLYRKKRIDNTLSASIMPISI
jgi:hypothetical protein